MVGVLFMAFLLAADHQRHEKDSIPAPGVNYWAALFWDIVPSRVLEQPCSKWHTGVKIALDLRAARAV